MYPLWEKSHQKGLKVAKYCAKVALVCEVKSMCGKHCMQLHVYISQFRIDHLLQLRVKILVFSCSFKFISHNPDSKLGVYNHNCEIKSQNELFNQRQKP